MTKNRPFSLLVKPGSADCNLRCEYCFYLKKCQLYPATKRHRMSDAVLEKMIRSYLATDQPVHSIGWQGGEPTLMGLDFFKKVTDLQIKHGRPGSSVANGLQTNATLIDDAMAEHFARYNFLLGCSLDGPPEIHNRYRHTVRGSPSHADVMKGIQTLRRHHVEFNILILVSESNAKHARRVYRYLTDQGFLYHQYIPCVEFDEEGQPLPFSISGNEWGDFLCELFDEWYPWDSERVSIRHFDSILSKMVDRQITTCTLDRNCCQYFVVEHNGDIYPCDFFVEKDLKIGNVSTMSWSQALASPIYKAFGARKARWNSACEKCKFLDLCSGDCLKHRVYCGGRPDRLSWLCTGWKRFFEHTMPRFEELARRLLERRREEMLQRQAQPFFHG